MNPRSLLFSLCIVQKETSARGKTALTAWCDGSMILSSLWVTTMCDSVILNTLWAMRAARMCRMVSHTS
uniref:Uncharacterized protein n=1 Tax=Ixodes ricinus TaxID=34613 RepID=A0A6B0U1Y8_IXORI